LRLFDANCNLVDEVLAKPSWPAGDNISKKTMERDSETRNWYTSAIIGGTPGKENSRISKQTVNESNRIVSTSSISRATSSDSEKIATSSPVLKNDQKAVLDSKKVLADCTTVNSGFPSRVVLINEVAWAGTASDKTSHEWIELKNNSWTDINLNNWQLLNKSGSIKVVFDDSDSLKKDEFYLLERTDDETLMAVEADKIFVGAIKNSDETLRLFNAQCELVDEVLAINGWPAGTASPEYRTAERSYDLSWHTYSGNGTNGIYGTPKASNSPPPLPAAQSSSQNSSFATSTGANSNTSSTANQSSTSTATTTLSQSSSSAINSIGQVLISEIFYDAEGSDVGKEFIELFNPTAGDIDLSNWSLRNGTSSLIKIGSKPEDLLVIKSRGFYLIGFNNYNGTPSSDAQRSVSLPNTSASIILSNAVDEIVDSVTIRFKRVKVFLGFPGIVINLLQIYFQILKILNSREIKVLNLFEN